MLLVEHIFYLVKEVLIVLLAFKTSELLKQAFLVNGQIGWRYYLDDDMLVATCTAVNHRYTHAFEAEGTVTLCAGGNFEGSCFTIDGWHLDFVAKSSLGETDGQFIDDIIALALEDMMRLYTKDDIEIARSATARANLAFAGYTHVYTIIYASRNIDYHAAIVTHTSLATALFTGSGNDAPFPATALTHRHIDELSKDRL